MEKLGILYYIGKYPTSSFILNEIFELYLKGHNIAIFAKKESNKNFTHNEHDYIDVPVLCLNASYTDFPKLVSKKSVQMALNHAKDGFFKHFSTKHIGHNLLLGTRCAQFVEALDFEIDVVHAHFADHLSIGAMFAARYHGIPCTVTAHAFEIFRSPDIPQLKYICNGMDHVIVPSEYNRDYLSEEIGIANDFTVVPATTRVEKFEPSAPTVENRLLTVARLVEKKGYPYGIEAVNKLVQRGYDVKYHIVGAGEMNNRLQRLVSEYGIENHVEFLGNVSDDRLQKELSEAAVFVLPCVIAEDGDRDAMPVALKEAMASETACVSTTVSAIPELITDGYDGLLVPEKEPGKLASAIQRLLDNPEKREDLATNGLDTVQDKFNIAESVNYLTKIFGSLQSKK